MIAKKIILLYSLVLGACSIGFGQGHVSLNVSQMLTFEQDPGNPTASIYIKLNTTNIEVKHMKSNRVMVTGNVQLGIPNLFFLEVLIKKGRYELFLSADGGNGLRLEDKSRQPIILQGETCKEDVFYTIFVPETVTTVVFENAETGISNVIAMNKEKKDTPANGTQVSIKDK
jgi:hypothetical protein